MRSGTGEQEMIVESFDKEKRTGAIMILVLVET